MSKKLSNRTLGELKLIAEEHGINADGLKKVEIVEALEAAGDNVIRSDSVKPSGNPTSGTRTNENGVLISDQPERVKSVKKREDSDLNRDRVALFSSRNLSWAGVGKISKGFNFVTREVADKWLVHKAVREASPEEVASHYGVK